MADISRLNGIIRALEQGQPALTTFTTAEVDAALALSTSKYDGIVFETEHNPWDARALRDCLQYLLNRRQIAQSAALAPAVTPLVRIPANGGEQISGSPSKRSISAPMASSGRISAPSRRPITPSPPAVIPGLNRRRSMSRKGSAATGRRRRCGIGA